METTPQNTQPQGQDKLALKSSDFKEDFSTIADNGSISKLLSHLGQVFGNTDLISAAKMELACIQDELLRKHQEAEPQLDFNDVELRTDIQEILESDYWIETVYIGYPSDMQVDCSGCDITVSDVEGEVEVRMSQGNAEVMAEKIMDFLEKRTKDA
jgi:hypothetical protein